jgi:hypothetical protein
MGISVRRLGKGYRMIGRNTRLGMPASVLICLLLAACAGATTTTRWVKAGSDDEAIARELRDCNAQANAALASERGINQDINVTLGRNWQLGGTLGLEDQSMNRQSVAVADQVLNNCMRAKGFTKEG